MVRGGGYEDLPDGQYPRLLWRFMVRGGGYEDSPDGQYPRLLQRFMATDKIMVRSRGYED
jgi:hypothetical protein